jgi:hypothetical protein
VWYDADLFGDFEDEVVVGARFQADGTPIGSTFRVNTTTSGIQRVPSIAADDSGNVIVVWFDRFDEGEPLRINGQRYDPSGNAVGGEITLATDVSFPFFGPGGGFTRTHLAFAPEGGLILAWDSDVLAPNGTDVSGRAVHARRFTSTGIPLGPRFQVNTSTSGDQSTGGLAVDSDGSFVVIYTSDSSTGSDTSGKSVQGQRFDNLGRPSGVEFQVNTAVVGDQELAAAGGNGAGTFAVAWRTGSIPNRAIHVRYFASAPLPLHVPALGPIGLIVMAIVLVTSGLRRSRLESH